MSRLENCTLAFGTLMNFLLMVEYLPYELAFGNPAGVGSRLASAVVECIFRIVT